jgi:hypothetical protein
MNLKYLITGVVAAALTAVSCSGPSLSGVETTNGQTVVALRSDGTPAAGATVRIVAEADWYRRLQADQGVLLDSLTTDNHGTFEVNPAWGTSVSLEIDADDEGFLQRGVSTDPAATADTLVCSSFGALLGKVQSAEATVRVAGTSYRTLTDASGAFRFSALPPGSLSAVIETAAGSGARLHFVGSEAVRPLGTSDLGTVHHSDTIPLSYFDKEWMATPLAPITRGGHWYPFDDALLNGSSTVTRSFTAGVSGKALRVDMTLGAAVRNPYAGVAVHITDQEEVQRHYVDLSSLRAIAFQARGSVGELEVNVNTYASQTSGRDWDRFRRYVSVTEEWREFVIAVDSLNTTILSTPWHEAARKANTINFVKSVPADATFLKSYFLELDNVRLIGLTVDRMMSEF